MHALLAAFHEYGKVVAQVCHGAWLQLWTRLSDGRLLAEGRACAGFTNEKEAAVNQAFAMTLNTCTIQGGAAGIPGTRFLHGRANKPFAVRDGRLTTGQQQDSSRTAVH